MSATAPPQRGQAPASGSISFIEASDTLLAKDTSLQTINAKLAATLKVDGSAVTQPVSGSIAVSNLPATQPVSGTLAISNFPATQPVSLAAMPSTPVTGTFWQATQPVSAASLPLPTGAATAANQTSELTKLDTLHTDLASTLTTKQQTLTWTQTAVTLTTATSATLIAANGSRKALRWMNVGSNPCTVAPGVVTVTAGSGMNYNGSAGTGQQGGSDSFSGELSTQAFSAISTLGTTFIVWEGA